MAAVHFTTILCKQYTAHQVQGNPFFSIFVFMLRLKVLEPKSVVKVFRALRIMGQCTSHDHFS